MFPRIISVVLAVILLAACHRDENQIQRERLAHVEKELVTQRSRTDRWKTLAAGLAIGCIVFLLVGAASGSMAKRDATK